MSENRGDQRRVETSKVGQDTIKTAGQIATDLINKGHISKKLIADHMAFDEQPTISQEQFAKYKPAIVNFDPKKKSDS